MVDPSFFRRALGQFASGITVVTTRDGSGSPAGLTASAFCSVSPRPPPILVCVNHHSDVNGVLASSGLFGVSVLHEGQEFWSRRFASGGPDKFADAELLTGVHGLPLVPEALVHLECRVRASHPEG